MFINSISNTKLHCCLIILILFLLIFLSLPLLLLWTNEYYQTIIEKSSSANSTAAESSSNDVIFKNNNNIVEITATTTTTTTTNISINCTEFAIQGNLSLVPVGVQCPAGSFPCGICPEICILQGRNCNGIPDCPDKSDEDSSICNDSNGALEAMYRKINPNQLDSQNLSKSTNVSYGLPKSCSEDDMLIWNCKCNLSETEVIVCENYHLDSVPTMILDSVYKIFLNNNIISDIDNVNWPKSLTFLNLDKNKLTTINGKTFENTKSLTRLYLDSNKISYIHPEAFKNLYNLTILQLKSNKISYIHPDTFKNLYNLKNLLIESNKLETFHSNMIKNSHKLIYLNLANNMIELPDDTKFGETFPLLEDIALDFNRITIIRKNFFSNMSSLNWLSLTNNLIYHIEDGSFDLNYKLEELNLSSNKLIFINRLTFAKDLPIIRLFLGSNTNLKTLPIDTFKELTKLESLNLSSIEFNYLNRATFSYLTKLEFIYFSKFRYCHYAPHVRVCKPTTDGLSSSKELLAFPILKFAVWIVAFVCIIGNIFVFIWRSISSHEDRILSLFVRNLSIADLMMGIYLATIAWQNSKFEQQFGLYAIEWMSSWTCTGIGFLAILSSELSVFILTIITIERYRSIVSINRCEKEEQKKRARLYVSLAWLFSFLIAFYPLIDWILRESDYYATNDLCLPLHIDQPFTRGWEYSAFIYLGINFLAVIIIFSLYLHMYTMIIDGRQATRPAALLRNEEKREDAILAIRFFFIVVTDCLCWIPIVVIKILALSNVPISSSIYGWLVVFIIPINSALNPIVYTLAAPTLLRDTVCRIFEQICYKIDLLTINESRYSSSSGHSSSIGSSFMTNSEHQFVNNNNNNIKKRNLFKSRGSNSTSTCDTFDTSIVSGQPGAALALESKGAKAESTFVQHYYHSSPPNDAAGVSSAIIKLDLRQQSQQSNETQPFHKNSHIHTNNQLASMGTTRKVTSLIDLPASSSNNEGKTNSVGCCRKLLSSKFNSIAALRGKKAQQETNKWLMGVNDKLNKGHNHVRAVGGGGGGSHGEYSDSDGANSEEQHICMDDDDELNNRFVVVDKSPREEKGNNDNYLSLQLQSQPEHRDTSRHRLLSTKDQTTTLNGTKHCTKNKNRHHDDNNNNNNQIDNDHLNDSGRNQTDDSNNNYDGQLIRMLENNNDDRHLNNDNNFTLLHRRHRQQRRFYDPLERRTSFSGGAVVDNRTRNYYHSFGDDDNGKNKSSSPLMSDVHSRRRRSGRHHHHHHHENGLGDIIVKEQLNVRRFTNPTLVSCLTEDNNNNNNNNSNDSFISTSSNSGPKIDSRRALLVLRNNSHTEPTCGAASDIVAKSNSYNKKIIYSGAKSTSSYVYMNDGMMTPTSSIIHSVGADSYKMAGLGDTIPTFDSKELNVSTATSSAN